MSEIHGAQIIMHTPEPIRGQVSQSVWIKLGKNIPVIMRRPPQNQQRRPIPSFHIPLPLRLSDGVVAPDLPITISTKNCSRRVRNITARKEGGDDHALRAKSIER
jgi:hypothetical protein